MVKSSSVRYSKNYKKIMDSNRRKKIFDNSFKKIVRDFVAQSKNKYIPIVTGFLRRSTGQVRIKNRYYKVVSRAYYADYVWYNAQDIWRRRWFIKVANVKSNMKRWEESLRDSYFK